MKHTPQEILKYLHWPENDFGDYFWDLRELVIAEIDRRNWRNNKCGSCAKWAHDFGSMGTCPDCAYRRARSAKACSQFVYPRDESGTEAE